MSTSKNHRYYVIGYLLVIAVALFQRGSLALVNREANDNHYEVMQLLSDGFRSLSMKNCHECFHPKMYYVVCVIVFKTLGVSDAGSQIVIAQFLNCVAGVITLWVVWLGLREQRAGKLSLFLTFAWVALNPRFIGINGQSSNDSFAIMFATIAIFFTWRLLRFDRSRGFSFCSARTFLLDTLEGYFVACGGRDIYRLDPWAAFHNISFNMTSGELIHLQVSGRMPV